MTSIFNKELFTLKELCILLFNTEYVNNNKQLRDIILCYINFSSGNNDYFKYLLMTRLSKGIIYINEEQNKILNFRELLQIFDMEFTKLVIRIKTECKNYDIYISWNDFEEKTKNISKSDFMEFIKYKHINKN